MSAVVAIASSGPLDCVLTNDSIIPKEGLGCDLELEVDGPFGSVTVRLRDESVLEELLIFLRNDKAQHLADLGYVGRNQVNAVRDGKRIRFHIQHIDYHLVDDYLEHFTNCIAEIVRSCKE